MSLKDDFQEAWRSVKRDFFRDSDSPSRDEQAPTQNNDIPVVPPPAFAQQPQAAQIPDPTDIQAGQVTPTYPDEDVLEAFKQASAINGQEEDWNTIDDAIRSVSPSDDEDGDYGDTTPYRNFGENDENGAHYTNRDYNNGYPVAEFEDTDRRGIYDHGDDIYSDDKTIISRNTVIRGALQTDDSVRLLGQVLGDIDCKSNIVVAGKVRGNTNAANAYIFDAQVDGDVRCDDVINISNDAWVLGNIRAQQAEIDGKIKGNIEIRHMVSIGATSSVLGDISADELEIKRGAFVNGQIMMYSPSRDVIDGFDQFDDKE